MKKRIKKKDDEEVNVRVRWRGEWKRGDEVENRWGGNEKEDREGGNEVKYNRN